MPTAPKTPCRHPGCPNLVPRGRGGRCDDHQLKPFAGTEERRGNARERGYDAAWERLRNWYIRQHPLCAECERAGRVTAAEHVDHIRPFRRPDGSMDDALRLDPSNLQSLCPPCHRAKSAREGQQASQRRQG